MSYADAIWNISRALGNQLCMIYWRRNGMEFTKA
jgi:hypothetical protein